MIERVARAMETALARTMEGNVWMGEMRDGRITIDANVDLFEVASAAIEAMREPTETQLRGLLRHRGYDPDAKEETLDALGNLDIMTMGTYVQAYRAMIDAAMEEPA